MSDLLFDVYVLQILSSYLKSMYNHHWEVTDLRKLQKVMKSLKG